MKKIILVIIPLGLILALFFRDKIAPVPPQEKPVAKADSIPDLPSHLNSRYKVDEIVKADLVDLNKDDVKELIYVTSYDDNQSTVFYYYGFARFNSEDQIWEEYFSEQLNILNIDLSDADEIKDKEEFKEKFEKMWAEEFTRMENLGDLTGDGHPEILFSSVIQGRDLRTNTIVAQDGKSHFRFIIYKAELPWGQLKIVDDSLVEEYVEFENNDYSKPLNTVRNILEWNEESFFFDVVDTSKTPYKEGGVEIPPEVVNVTG